MDLNEAKEEIRSRLDLVEIIGRHVRLERAGSRYRGLCPFHEEKTPSFYVHPERGLWHCFGCGAGGDLYAFVMRQERLDFPEALRRLAERAGVRLEVTPRARQAHDERQAIERANRLARDHFVQNLFKHPAAERARQYVRNRGFGAGVVRDFQLGFALDSWNDLLQALQRQGVPTSVLQRAGLARPSDRGGLYDQFRNRLIFPIVDVNDRVLGFGGRALDPDNPAKYLNSPETPLFHKRRTLYGLKQAHQAITEQNRALIVEGYTDVLALHQAGVRNVVAGLGTALTAEQLKLLSRYCEEIVFVYDGDSAGTQAALRNLELLETASTLVTLVVLPSGLDPDEFVRRHGREQFEQLLANRVTPVEYRIRMIFQGCAGRGREALARGLREVARVLVQVPDHARRLTYLRLAGDLWGARDTRRAAAIEQVICREMDALARNHGYQHPARVRDSVADTLLDDQSKGIIKAETELLILALDNEEVARQVVAELTPQHMVLGADQAIMLALKDQLADGGSLDCSALVERLSEEEGVRQRAVELMVAQVREPRTVTPEVQREMVGGAIEVLRAHRLAAGQTRKSWCAQPVATTELAPEEFRQLEAWVQEKINAGDLDREDARYQRYCELKAALRRPGPEGYAEDILPTRPTEPPSLLDRQQQSASPAGTQRAEPRDVWAAEEGDPFADQE